jgi:hypothetical protein
LKNSVADREGPASLENPSGFEYAKWVMRWFALSYKYEIRWLVAPAAGATHSAFQ